MAKKISKKSAKQIKGGRGMDITSDALRDFRDKNGLNKKSASQSLGRRNSNGGGGGGSSSGSNRGSAGQGMSV